MREFSIENKLQRILNKLYKKDKEAYQVLINKIEEILNYKDVEHYKNLKKPLQYLKRVHVKSSFVLTFKYIKSEDKIIFYNYNHHDNIYK